MLALRHLTRFRAAAIHLGISGVVALATVVLMLAFWYPPPLFGAMGGKLLILLIVGVDVAIGPLITLIIFDPRKEELVYDLSVVAILQLAALAYGVYAMHAGRPVYIAFVENRFAAVAAAELDDEALAQARPEFRTLPHSGPALVAVNMPTDVEALNEIAFIGLGGLGAQHLPKYYAPYAEHATQAVAASRPLDRLKVGSAEEKNDIQAALKGLGRPTDELRFLPMVAKDSVLTALIDAKTGALLGTIAARPLTYGSTVVP